MSISIRCSAPMIIVLGVMGCFSVAAQQKEQAVSDYQLAIHRVTEPIQLDGLLDEPAWQAADVAADFYQSRPYDTSFAQLQTTVRLAFDDQFLFIGVVCYQPKETYTVASLKRDFEGGASDVFVVNFDPFRDGINGFSFGLSPFNVQREGLIDQGQNVSMFWDNRWFSQVHNYDDRWEAEIAIPFKTLRYKRQEGANIWHVNFGRNCLHTNEISSWVPVPRNFNPYSLAFTGELHWADPPPAPGLNVSLIPYLTGGFAQDYPREESDLTPLPKTSDLTGNLGLDAKIGVTPSLNLDVTINPDFSQVEVDRQVTNLSRFELFFPERRQFFLENNDLFGVYGFPNTRPFFSRRIGLAFDPTLGQNVTVPILAGVRLSGKLNQNWRLGLLDMQTKHVDFGSGKELPAANFAVATVQRRVFKRSVLGAVVVNKQNFLNQLPESSRGDYKAYNRVAGLEFNYYSPDNKWETETYFHRSFSPDQGPDANSFAHFTGFSSRHWQLWGAYNYVGKDYQPEAGFVPRPGVQSIFLRPNYTAFPGGRLARYFNAINLGLEGDYVFDLGGRTLDRSSVLFLSAVLPDFSEGRIGVSENFTYLDSEYFDPTNPYLNPDPEVRENERPLPAGNYTYLRWEASFQSSPRHNLFVQAAVSGGQYFNGHGLQVNADLGYRFQPIGIVSLAVSYNDIAMPEPYNSGRYWLVGPRAELSFSRSLFFSTFLQYNQQTNNLNINTRLQWRFAPVSDLFFVYTDNYFAEPMARYGVERLASRNRTLVLKLTYWLNL